MKQRIKAIVMLVVFSIGLVSQPVQKVSAKDKQDAYYAETLEDEMIAMQRALANHDEGFTIKYLASNEDNFSYDTFVQDDYYYSNPAYANAGYGYNNFGGEYGDSNDGYVTENGQKWYYYNWYFNYQDTKSEYNEIYDKVHSLIKNSGITKSSDYEKAHWAYNWISDNVKYSYEDSKNNSAYSAIKGATRCEGYAELFYIFATELGLNCRYVSGLLKGDSDWGGHAWNIVELDGQWYQVDATLGGSGWGDAYFMIAPQSVITHKLGYDSTKGNFNFATSNSTGSSQNSGILASVYDIEFDNVNMERLNIDEEYKWLISNPDNVSLTLSSSNESVASVDSKGMITANNEGKTTVQAVNTDLGIIQTCEITVSKVKASTENIIDDEDMWEEEEEDVKPTYPIVPKGATIYNSVQEVLEAYVKVALTHENNALFYMTEDAYEELRERVSEKDFLGVAAEFVDSNKTSKDGDYLPYFLTNHTFNAWYTKCALEDGTIIWRMASSYGYSISKAKNEKLDVKIKTILKSLKLSGKSDYYKVKSIHDYLLKNSSYGASNNTLEAYGVLINKKGVCQSYATAAYRLFTDAGIECKFVGEAAHVWNVVKIDGKWYHIDVTWDENTGKGKLNYKYFLKGSNDFVGHKEHIREYTSNILKKLPIATTGYKK